MSLAVCCGKERKETIAKSNRTGLLPEKMPFKKFVKNISSRMLPKKVRSETIVKNNRTEMLLKELP